MADHSNDRVIVMRLIEYDGPREWVEATLARSVKNEQITIFRTGLQGYIRELHCTDYITMEQADATSQQAEPSQDHDEFDPDLAV
jgi:hypothetical protein